MLMSCHVRHIPLNVRHIPLYVRYIPLDLRYPSQAYHIVSSPGCAAILRVSNRRVSLDDNIIQMTITVATAHISFVLAEYVVNVSGVISTVFSGIVLSWLGASLILEVQSFPFLSPFLVFVFIFGYVAVYFILHQLCGIVILFYLVQLMLIQYCA
jgi:hypothetical protein